MTKKPTVHIDEIIYSNRKTFGISIQEDGKLIVRSPRKAHINDVYKMVNQAEDWIRKKKITISVNAKIQRQYISGEKFFYLGELFSLTVEKDIDYALKYSQEKFHLREDHREFADELFAQFYKIRAKALIPKMAYELAEKGNIPINQVKITSAKARWGSCNTKGNINFSWRLVQAPKMTINAVIIHELAHRYEMNHSKKFWSIVYKLMPEYDKYDAWLKDNRMLLI